MTTRRPIKPSAWFFSFGAIMAIIINGLLLGTGSRDERLVGPMGPLQLVAVWLIWNLVPIIACVIGWSLKRHNR